MFNIISLTVYYIRYDTYNTVFYHIITIDSWIHSLINCIKFCIGLAYNLQIFLSKKCNAWWLLLLQVLTFKEPLVAISPHGFYNILDTTDALCVPSCITGCRFCPGDFRGTGVPTWMALLTMAQCPSAGMTWEPSNVLDAFSAWRSDINILESLLAHRMWQKMHFLMEPLLSA